MAGLYPSRRLHHSGRVYCVPFRQNQRIGQDDRKGFVHLHKQSVVFNVKIHTTLCSPNLVLELLTLSVRPFCLPREFSNIVLCCVYVPLSADALAAADTIASYLQSMLLRYPYAPVFVMGDFNSCTLDTALPSFHQYVHVPTRNNETIDLFYGNIPSAYRTKDIHTMKNAQRQLQTEISQAKQRYRENRPLRI